MNCCGNLQGAPNIQYRPHWESTLPLQAARPHLDFPPITALKWFKSRGFRFKRRSSCCWGSYMSSFALQSHGVPASWFPASSERGSEPCMINTKSHRTPWQLSWRGTGHAKSQGWPGGGGRPGSRWLCSAHSATWEWKSWKATKRDQKKKKKINTSKQTKTKWNN